MDEYFRMEMKVETTKSANKLTFYSEFCTLCIFVISAQLVLLFYHIKKLSTRSVNNG